MIIVIYPFLSLIGCIAILLAIIFPWRKHPDLSPIFNFKRPCWLSFFVSFGITVFSFISGELLSLLIRRFFVHYDSKGIIYFPFVLFTILGVFCCLLSSIWCLWRIVAGIFSYVKSKQSHNK